MRSSLPAPQLAHASRFQKWALSAFLLFVLVFPKGGLKLGTVPITWGYILLALFALCWLFRSLAMNSFLSLARERWLALLCLLPFQFVILSALALLGFSDTGYALSLIAGFVGLPVVMLMLGSASFDKLDLQFLAKWFRWGVLLVALYGIGLFFAKIATGKFLEVPYLTVNADDVGHLEDKNNDRGFAFKLISTYNNGNVYGASLLMLLPPYALLERKRWRVLVVKMSLVMTLSRTAWIGLVVYELLAVAYIHAPPLRQLFVGRVERKWMRRVFALGAVLAIFAAVLAAVVIFSGLGSSFLWDRNLGGRADQLSYWSRSTLFPSVPFDSITEIVYLSILNQFGWIGLFTFILGMLAPLALQFAGLTRFGSSKFKKSIACGLAIYLVIAASDGAILLIPVLLFYWSLVGLLLSRNPGFAAPVTALQAA